MSWNPRVKHEIPLESIGTVTVSTVYLYSDGRPCSPYWETAIMWPESWAGADFCADGHAFDIVGCDRTQEDSVETHQHWCDAERLARMAAAHMRNRYTQDDWHSPGRHGTWEERSQSA